MLLTQPNKFTVSTRTIKHNHLFLVDTMTGVINSENDSGLGLYNLDTRFLSCLEIHLNNTEPVCLLSSTELGYLSTLVYTNGQMESRNLEDDPCIVPEETIQLKRESVLNNAFYEKLTLTSYNVEPVKVCVSIRYNADFRDIFEVRHLIPPIQREIQPPQLEEGALTFTYHSPDQQIYKTRILFKDFTPQFIDTNTISFETMLFPLENREFNIEIQTLVQSAESAVENNGHRFDTVVRQIDQSNQMWRNEVTHFCSDNEDFNEMVERSHKDIQMLLTRSDKGTFVAAGIPWYVTLFGRDSIITARESLIFNPELAKETLCILAKYQGSTFNPQRDEEPGKILHELRTGELADRELIPHTPYYGSVDATPLWIMLLYDYYHWTRDLETVKALWPTAMAALQWVDYKLNQSGLGYLTYFTQCTHGIIHQGWKDSNNSAMYENGLQAEPPIALAEVQGYVYLAKKRMAFFADLLGEKALKAQLKKEAQAFKTRFNEDFWIPEKKYCALGLDSQGNPLRVVASNPGHCLETGIFSSPRSRQVASRLMAEDMFSGWGIRTLSSETLAYNPMSYHNGSVWPHDNAMVARGLSTIGRWEDVDNIFSGLFEAARLMFYKRLPELFCGFPRDPEKADPPVRYPVACSPQAWAAAAVFALIQSMLNLTPDLQNHALRIERPHLPSFMNQLSVRNLRVGNAQVDLMFRRADRSIVVDVQNRRGKLDVLIKS